jgi:hypothetical protein
MTRPDIVWRRHADGAVFIRNLKTVRDPKTTWREQWALDMQTLSEPLAAEAWLAKAAYTAGEGSELPATITGVIIDGLITGAVLEYPRGSGKWYHNTPLVYAWRQAGDAPFGADAFYPRYEWTCTAPHKFANGRSCPGDRTHKLSGVTKVPVEQHYPGGQLAWLEHLFTTERALLEEQIIELPPILRSPYQIERWKRMVLGREVRINHDAQYVQNPSVPDHYEERLDLCFPMHTASGNCLRPGRCMAMDLCHGTAAADPFAAGYRPRTPHHADEVTQNES